VKYLAKKSRNRGRRKSRQRPRGVAGYRPRFRYSWSDELDVRAAVKAGEEAAAR